MRRTLLLGLLSAAGILCNFLFQTYLLVALGPGGETDAFFASMALPQLVTAVVMATLVNILVPLLAGEEQKAVAPDAWAFLVLTCGFFAVLVGTAWLTAPVWAPLLVPGFSPPGAALMVELTRIQLAGLWFSVLSVVLTALWQARERFVYPELCLAVATGASLAAVVWVLPRWGVKGAAWLTAARMILLCALLMPGLPRLCRPRFDGPMLREAWRRLKPLLLGNSYLRAGPLVDRVLSSMAPAGGLSLLYLARQIYVAVHLVLYKAVTAPAVPELASCAKAGDWHRFFHIYRSRLFWCSLPTLAVCALLAVAGRPLLSLLIGLGGVTAANVDLLLVLLLALSGMLVGVSLSQVTTAAFYAAGDTATPTRIGVATFTIAVPLKVLFFLEFGLIALPVTSSVYVLVTVALQMSRLRRLRPAS